MKKTICLVMLLLLSTIKIDATTGNNEIYSINMPTDFSIGINAKTIESQNSSITSIENKDNNMKIKYKYINNLKEMEIINLNNSNNTTSKLVLPINWRANKAIYQAVDSFEFKQQKNKKIRKLYSYEIFNDENSLEGYFEFNGGGIPNHCVVEKIIYNGSTKLGNGIIYLLDCGLPKEKTTEKYSTYKRIFSVIPIENEVLVYSISISVPLDENTDKYIEIMKTMLIEKSK
ncbi:hypothetical protein [Clostridium sp.]